MWLLNLRWSLLLLFFHGLLLLLDLLLLFLFDLLLFLLALGGRSCGLHRHNWFQFDLLFLLLILRLWVHEWIVVAIFAFLGIGLLE